MKKMITIAAVALCAAMVQAVAVQWTANTVTSDGTTAGKLAKGTITGYAFDASTSVDAALAAIQAGGDTLAALQRGGTGASESADGLVGGAAATVSETDYAPLSKHSFYAIIIDSSSNQYIVTATKEVTMKSTGATNINFGSQQSNHSWTPLAVPEPTTVALLALGLAALGLKRKVA